MLAPPLLAAVAVCSAVTPQPRPQPETLIGHWSARLAALARPDGRHGTFGPTGRRLWATRLEPRPGFRGQFHYVHETPELVDPLELELTDGAGNVLPLAVRAQEWQPSHSTVRYAVEGSPAEVLEEKWITPDDVLVTRVAVHGVPAVGVRWRSPLAPEPLGDPARFTAVSLAGLATEDLQRSARLRVGEPRAPIFAEAEDYARQAGSEGPDRRAAASGGRVLGRAFGAARGHEAGYLFTASGEGRWTLVARYARASAGEATFAVTIDGVPAGVLRCAPTAGWGDREEDFAYARLPLGEVRPGPAELALTAEADGSNTNFDGFFLIADDGGEVRLPPRESWPGLDPMRGALRLPGGRIVLDGVPFAILPPMGPQGVGAGAPIPVGGAGARLHVLAIPIGPDAELACGELRQPLGPRRRALRDHVVSLTVPASGELELALRDSVVLGVTRENAPPGASHERRGHQRYHGVATGVRVGLHGLAEPWHATPGADGVVRFCATVELTGDGVAGAATEAALHGDDTLALQQERYALWFARNAPRWTGGDRFLQRLWTYRWFVVRHNLAEPAAGLLPVGPVVYEGRHGSWYPRVITFSTPHIVAETRWLADPAPCFGNVRALLAAQTDAGVLPNVRVDAQGFRYTHWIPYATVEAFKVHPDRNALAQMLPALVHHVEGVAAAFDGDGDGLLAVADHYQTGMEFQPSFWAFDGYDNSKPPAALERPDFNSYHCANARALASAARWLGLEGEAERLSALAERTRQAMLDKLWHAEDGFFYAVREHDDAPARCKEVVGFYPFRFGLVPDEPQYARALAALVDPQQFWTAVPVASCAQTVPVYSADAQRWPGPGGVVRPCMWNGPVWPHADSVVADAMAAVLRDSRQDAFAPMRLGELMQRFALFHCEDADPAKPLLREYGSAASGVAQGCPDYMHSTFNDLLIRHAAGLVPRFDDVLEVRPLPLGLGDFAVEDIPYHGRRIGISVVDDRLRVHVDGELAGEGSVAAGLHLSGFL